MPPSSRVAPRLAAVWLVALVAACAARTVPLTAASEAGETAATRIYRVEELEFEAPAGWTSSVDSRAFAAMGGAVGGVVGAGCDLPPGWGDPTALASAGRVDRTGCPTLVVAPATDFTAAECLDDETFGRHNRWLASSGELARRRDTIDARLARRFDWKVSEPQPGRAVIWCVCGPSRPWYFTFWIPADAEAEGAAALRLFQRTVTIGQAWLAP